MAIIGLNCIVMGIQAACHGTHMGKLNTAALNGRAAVYNFPDPPPIITGDICDLWLFESLRAPGEAFASAEFGKKQFLHLPLPGFYGIRSFVHRMQLPGGLPRAWMLGLLRELFLGQPPQYWVFGVRTLCSPWSKVPLPVEHTHYTIDIEQQG